MQAVPWQGLLMLDLGKASCTLAADSGQTHVCRPLRQGGADHDQAGISTAQQKLTVTSSCADTGSVSIQK